MVDDFQMPGSKPESSSALIMPKLFAQTYQKQKTGRDVKKTVSESFLGIAGENGIGSFFQDGFYRIQRGFTNQKVYEEKEQFQDTLDPKLAVTSIKSITRPSNISGMASHISRSSHRIHDDETDDRRIKKKPTVQFKENVQILDNEIKKSQEPE